MAEIYDIHATSNKRGQYRVYGYGVPQRVWIATAVNGETQLKSNTLMKIKDAHGAEQTVEAGVLNFDHIKTS